MIKTGLDQEDYFLVFVQLVFWSFLKFSYLIAPNNIKPLFYKFLGYFETSHCSGSVLIRNSYSVIIGG